MRGSVHVTARTLAPLGEDPSLDETLGLRNARRLRVDLPLVPELDLSRSVGSNPRDEAVVPIKVAAAI